MEYIRKAVSGQKYYYMALGLLWCLYVVLSLVAPQGQVLSGRYQISLSSLNLIRLSVLLPYLIIWMAALFAALRFQYYAKLVSSSPEGKGFKNLSLSLWILLVAIIVPQFFAMIPTYYPNSEQTLKIVTIFRNYLGVVLYLYAFWTILASAENLNSAIVTVKINLNKRRILATILMVVLGMIYSWAVFQNQYRTISHDATVRPTYYLNDGLIVPTIIVPYILIWILGSWAILNIHYFSKHVQGVVYRKAFSSVNLGLATIIGLSILLQFLIQAAAFFGRASLGLLLVIVYPLIIVIAAGYIFIARGARALASIEEV